MARQAAIIRQLLDANRLGRLSTIEIQGGGGWPLPDYLDALKAAVWRSPASTATNAYRRALQRAYVDRLGALLVDAPAPAAQGGFGGGNANRTNVAMSDIRPLVRAQLLQLRTEAERAAGQTNDRVARSHLRDIVVRIDEVLDPAG
jgi:hypothetical protein